jgi:hypothetical protein
MTNIRIDIGLTGLLDTTSNPITVSSTGSFDILLSPFYATEQDIIGPYADEVGEYTTSIRRHIFEASIKVDQILTTQRVQYLGLTDQELFMLKRNYVICWAVYQFGKVFYRDYLKSIKKSKFLGDFKVSLEVEKEPSLIQRIADDAKECYEELEELFGLSDGMGTFVKGRYNECNQRSDRQWWPGDRTGYPHIPIAATKSSTFCRRYKIGAIIGRP